MKLSPVLSQLSGVILSGILLAGNVFVPSTSQSLVVNPPIMPATLTSYSLSAIIPQFLHQQLPSNMIQLHLAQVTSRKTQVEVQTSRGGSNSSDIVNHALSLVGTPYVFGGTTRKGFDCSGFTQYIFAGSNISLSRTSYAQFASGVAVSKSDLHPGDLVFFTTYSKGASHVGIYIGGGRFVHADNPRVGVTITSLSNNFYTNHYLGARRYD